LVTLRKPNENPGEVLKICAILITFLTSFAANAESSCAQLLGGNTDYYSLLGVVREASPKEIKKAYQSKAAKTHPDRHANSAESNRAFQEIGEAYSVLKDPEKRAAYDRVGPSYSNDFKRAGEAYANEDLYSLLGVNRSASYLEIKDAYDKKLSEFNLKGGVSGIVVAPRGTGYAAVADAYSILSDPDLREIYDHRSRLIEPTFLGGLENHRYSEFDNVADSQLRLEGLLKSEMTRESLDYLFYRLKFFPHRLHAIEQHTISDLVQEYVKTNRDYNSSLILGDLRYFKEKVALEWFKSPLSKNNLELAVRVLQSIPRYGFFDTFRRSHWVHRANAVNIMKDGYGPIDYGSLIPSDFEDLIRRQPQLTVDPQLMDFLEQFNITRHGRLFLTSIIRDPTFLKLPYAGFVLRMWRQRFPKIAEWSWAGAFNIPAVAECLARDSTKWAD
jgi:curved DNA-binding protein CbpA